MFDRTGRGARGSDSRNHYRASGIAANANPLVGPIPVQILGPVEHTVVAAGRVTGFSSAEGSLQSGAPPPGPVSGSIVPQLTALFSGAKPVTDAATFNARLGDALRALVPGATVARSFSIAVSEPYTFSFTRATPTAAQLTPVALIGGVPALAGVGVATLALYLRGLNQKPYWWATISGGVVQSRTPMDQARLRQAFARAFWQASTWEAAPGVTVPSDGGPLQNALNRPDACTGGNDQNAFVTRACLRWIYQREESLAIVTGAQPQSQAPGTTTPTPATSPVSSPQTAAPLCTVTSREQFWLRPTATFDRVGPNFPAGTRVEILSRAQGNRGALSLYQARVNAQVGYVAMSDREVASCGTSLTGAARPQPSSTPPQPRIGSSPTPRTSAALSTQLPLGSGQYGSSAGRIALYAGGAMVAAGAVAALVLTATSKRPKINTRKATR